MPAGSSAGPLSSKDKEGAEITSPPLAIKPPLDDDNTAAGSTGESPAGHACEDQVDRNQGGHVWLDG